MILRKKFGYVISLSVAVHGILLQIVILLATGGNSLVASGWLNMSAMYVLILLLQALVFLAVGVLLLLPAGRRHFGTGIPAVLGGIGLGVFLVLDYMLCTYVLTPWAFG